MNNILSFLSNFFTDIANAIRQKDSDITEEMTISLMVTNINNIHPHIEIVLPSQIQKTYDSTRDSDASSSRPNILICREVSTLLVNNIDHAYCIISLHSTDLFNIIATNLSDPSHRYVISFFPEELRKGRVHYFSQGNIKGYDKQYLPNLDSEYEAKQFIINGHLAENNLSSSNRITIKLPLGFYFARGSDYNYYVTFIYNG